MMDKRNPYISDYFTFHRRNGRVVLRRKDVQAVIQLEKVVTVYFEHNRGIATLHHDSAEDAQDAADSLEKWLRGGVVHWYETEEVADAEVHR